MTSAESIVALNALPNIGPIRVRRLVERFGSAESVLRAPANKLRSVSGIGPETAETIRNWEDLVDPGAELRRAREMGVTVLTQEDESWPAPLREIYDAPLVLYVWGASFQIARAGFTVVSGLARGIDTAAHEAAIAANGRTIAVVGSGLSKLYPPENFPLAEKIASGFGAVVTEFPLDTAPSKQTFPMRNRIVAGWARARPTKPALNAATSSSATAPRWSPTPATCSTTSAPCRWAPPPNRKTPHLPPLPPNPKTQPRIQMPRPCPRKNPRSSKRSATKKPRSICSSSAPDCPPPPSRPPS